ncbi:cytochrome C biogenesis protein [Sulfurimonas aquatica]|uniref:Cytochrome C biogenesis protein n=1 Tax=Sulfurimonas aquatica TaxID=2672570 RepID=A0A975GD47_9BACT|nr:cytochrome c biogenesis protein CcsA [Sulfurimonas aquatica]QSZ41978.1 cytochrome C biogenesis protein [Sulfurimonas aquatica]
MKQLISLFRSMKTMAILMLIFAISVGYATIVENDFGTMTAKAEIYNARWFEILLGLLAVNLSLNIVHFKMYTLKKAPIFIFHLAFLVILIGAAITRYAGYEGNMHIREGSTSSTITSAETFYLVNASVNGKKAHYEEALYLSKRRKNDVSTSLEVDGKNVDIELLEYIPDAMESLEEDANGHPIAKLMITNSGKGKPVALDIGMYYDAGNFILDFNSGESFDKPVISMYMEGDELFMKHDMKLSFFRMADRAQGDLVANVKEAFHTRVLYSTDLGSFVLRDFMPKASKTIVSNPDSKMNSMGVDALRFKVTVDGKSDESLVYGRAKAIGQEQHLIVNGVDVHIAYGAKEIPIPFKIKLLDFQLDRYPGSMSPASYASEVELIDTAEGVRMPFRIYMNHILDYQNFRFFQASYDQDEKGTVLSVNNDPGTLPTYIGYTLLALGMFWTLFTGSGRFSKLSNKAKKAAASKVVPALLALGLVVGVTPTEAAELDPSIKTILAFDKEHSKKFGQLIVQDTKGRMKPMDTLATEILAKVYSSSSLKVAGVKLIPTQVVLGMMIRPDIYRDVKLIKTKDEEINRALGAKLDAKYVSFSQFFMDAENMRGYKLAEIVEAASRKEPKHRNKLDKAALKVDEKLNVAYMVFTGSLLKIWPKTDDANNKWFATIEALQTFQAEEGMKVRNIAVAYFNAVDTALSSGNWSESDKAAEEIIAYQKDVGAAVYPSENKINAEVFYNKTNVFEALWPLYFIVGFILLILSFTKILYPKMGMSTVTKASLGLLILFFVAHTMGLALRWYISGHAPWSNGFESMTYIAWATVLAGFIFSRHSPITLASTSILAGLILFVAHLSWMNPQITNLVPVLNSYWLSIHVSMITASYGFLALGALLGFIVIILFIVKTKKNENQISLSIKELNAINEMSIIIGLVLLTVGNFLGGVWANESWGRYWGWDPKETWALVTILVYAVVIHLRFIKTLYSEFNFAVVSLLSFTTVLMTYFGVNYYLAGMHSYAKGDPVPIPDFVPVTYAIVFIVIALAFRNRKIV